MTKTAILDERAVSEIESRANAATEGLWEQRFVTGKGYTAWVVKDRGSMQVAVFGHAETFDKDNAEFTAHAREDIPALCATVKHLRAERLEIQRTLASSVLNDPTEDDDPPYSSTELVEGVWFILKMKEAKAARVKDLQSQLEQLRAENERLREQVVEAEKAAERWFNRRY